MSVPVVLAVLLNIQTTLLAVRRSGGYNFDILNVVLDPRELETVNPTDTPFIVVDEEPGEGTNDFGSNTSRPFQVKQDFTVRLRCRLDAPGDDPSRLKTAAWNFHQDVEKALVVDTTRGARTLYTYVQWPSFYWGLAAQSQIYAEIPVQIKLNRVYGAP